MYYAFASIEDFDADLVIGGRAISGETATEYLIGDIRLPKSQEGFAYLTSIMIGTLQDNRRAERQRLLWRLASDPNYDPELDADAVERMKWIEEMERSEGR